MRVHQAPVAVCFISPALISTCWNTFTCSTASGLYSTPTKSVSLSLCRLCQWLLHCFHKLCGAQCRRSWPLRCKREAGSYRYLFQLNRLIFVPIYLSTDHHRQEAWELVWGLEVQALCVGDYETSFGTKWNTWLSFNTLLKLTQFRHVQMWRLSTTTLWRYQDVASFFFSRMTPDWNTCLDE